MLFELLLRSRFGDLEDRLWDGAWNGRSGSSIALDGRFRSGLLDVPASTVGGSYECLVMMVEMALGGRAVGTL